MLQSVATIAFLLLSAMGVAVIAASLLDDWSALRQALGMRSVAYAPLPARIRAVAGTRRARIVRVSPSTEPSRAAA